MAKKEYIDLRSSADLPKFNKLIDSAAKKGIFILVHADFCGPCQNYKKEVWNDLVENKNRKAELAAIHYDQLEHSPFSDAKIKGYPSVLYVSKNGSVKRVSNFNDSESGSMTNAMPSADMRNKELMNSLINAEPKDIDKMLPNLVNEPVVSDNEPEFDAETSAIRNEVSAEKAVENVKNMKTTKNKGSPPKSNTDVLDSQKDSPVMDFNPNETENTPKPGKGIGGSLYSTLLNVARQKARNNTKKKTKKRGTKTRSK